MPNLVSEKIDEIIALCNRYGVQELYVFGSAANGDFNPERSDLDFAVLFKPCTPEEHYQRYFGLVESLEDLFLRHVDLVEIRAIRNPYFRKSLEETRRLLYAA